MPSSQPAALNIKAWSAWAPGLASGQAKSSEWSSNGWSGHRPSDPSPKHAHLDTLSKMTLQVARACIPESDQPGDAINTDEMLRTYALLEDTLINQAGLPKSFNVSVHNTAIGLYGTVNGTLVPNVIESNLEIAFLDAHARLENGQCHEAFLFVADGQAPKSHPNPLPDTEAPFALALRVSLNKANDSGLTLQLAEPANGHTRLFASIHPVTLIRSLVGYEQPGESAA